VTPLGMKPTGRSRERVLTSIAVSLVQASPPQRPPGLSTNDRRGRPQLFSRSLAIESITGRVLTREEGGIGEDDEEAPRDAARLKAIVLATFEPLPLPNREILEITDLKWRCRICGGLLGTQDEARRQHLEVHGPVPVFVDEWWWIL